MVEQSFPIPGANEGNAVTASEARRLRDLSQACKLNGDNQNGLQLAEQAAQCAAASGEVDEQAQAWALVSLHSLRLSQTEDAVRAGEKALRLFESLDDAEGQSGVHSTLAVAFRDAHLWPVALEHGLAAWRTAISSGSKAAQVWALLRLMMTTAPMGQPGKAIEYGHQALALARQVGSDEMLFAALNNLAVQLLDNQDGSKPQSAADHAALQEALGYAHEALDVARRSGNAHQVALGQLHLGRILTALQQTDAAGQYLSDSLRLCQQNGYRNLALGCQALMAAALRAQGRTEEAIAAYQAVVDDEKIDVGPKSESHLALYELLKGAGRFEGALKQHEALFAQTLKEQKAKSDIQGRLLLVKFELHSAQQDAQRARLETELQRLRAEQADRAAEQLAQQRDLLENMVSDRTVELASARDAAEAANRAKTAFMANMSHELRTPLNGMLGLSELARRRATDPKQIDQLGKALQSGQHLLRLVNDILDITNIEAERVTLQPREFQLSALIDECLQMQEATIESKDLHVVRQIAPGLAEPLIGDSVRLKQILINLTSNAIKFTRHGQVLVRAEAIEQSERGLTLRLEVVDQGIGISAQDQASLFQPFHQVDDSLTRRYGGAGLGLRIAQRLAKLMGGEVGVRSELGQGSTFWATVKLRRADASLIKPPAEPDGVEDQIRKRFGGALVLLAEDNPINLEVAIEMLSICGLQVDLAMNGQECVDKARQGGHALIVMDLQMPVLSGIEATRAIRAMPGRSDVPIMAITSSAYSQDRDACLDAGMDDYIAKPVQWGVAYAAILRLLDRPARSR